MSNYWRILKSKPEKYVAFPVCFLCTRPSVSVLVSHAAKGNDYGI